MDNEIIEISEEELKIAGDILFNTKQLNFLFKRTPDKYIKERPAKGGGKWKYVNTNYTQKTLNLLFGWDWDFEIISEIINDYQVIVKGKLTCRIGDKVITRTQYGRKDIAFKTEFVFDTDGKPVYIVDSYGKKKQKKQATKEPLDLGNDLKAAASDCLKKCASSIGIASDVYGEDDYKEIEIVDSKPKLEAPLEEKNKETERVLKFITEATTLDDLATIYEMIDPKNEILVKAYNKKKEELENA